LFLPFGSQANWHALLSFGNEFLKRSFADLVFSLAYLEKLMHHQLAYLLLLVEHKSKQPPKDWPVEMQLQQYVWEINDEYIRQHHYKNTERRRQNLPPVPLVLPDIAPVLIHHGPTPWSQPTWAERKSPGSQRLHQKGMPKQEFEYILYDLAVKPDDEIEAFYADCKELLVAMLLLKHIHDKDFAEKAKVILAKLNSLPDNAEVAQFINSISVYLKEAMEPTVFNSVIEQREIDQRLINNMITAREGFIQQGEERGTDLTIAIIQALQEGRKAPDQIAQALNTTVDKVLSIKKRMGL